MISCCLSKFRSYLAELNPNTGTLCMYFSRSCFSSTNPLFHFFSHFFSDSSQPSKIYWLSCSFSFRMSNTYWYFSLRCMRSGSLHFMRRRRNSLTSSSGLFLTTHLVLGNPVLGLVGKKLADMAMLTGICSAVHFLACCCSSVFLRIDSKIEYNEMFVVAIFWINLYPVVLKAFE